MRGIASGHGDSTTRKRLAGSMQVRFLPYPFIAGGLGPSESHKLRVLGAIPRPATESAVAEIVVR